MFQMSSTFQKLNLHLFVAHGTKYHIRRYVHPGTTRCLVCLKEFFSREHSLNHLRYRAAVCRANIVFYGTRASDEGINAEDLRLRELYRDFNYKGHTRCRTSSDCVWLPGCIMSL